MPTTTGFEQMLREAALRVTRPRVAVLSAVHAHPHADTDRIIGAVRRQICARSPTRPSTTCCARSPARGLVRRIQPAGSVARYESRVGDNHHHVVCRGCGAIADVDCAVGETPCLTASDDHGFAIDEAEVIYWGRCPACSTAADRAPPEHQHRASEQHQTQPPATAPKVGREPDAIEENEPRSRRRAPSSRPRKPPAEGGASNRDWWPNQLNLTILRKNTGRGEPDRRRLRLRRGVRRPSTSTA